MKKFALLACAFLVFATSAQASDYLPAPLARHGAAQFLRADIARGESQGYKINWCHRQSHIAEVCRVTEFEATSWIWPGRGTSEYLLRVVRVQDMLQIKIPWLEPSLVAEFVI